MLATLLPDGAITVPTKYGNIVLPEGSYRFIYGKTVIKVTQTVVGDRFKLRAGRVLVSNVKAGIFLVFKTMLTARRGLIHLLHTYGTDDRSSEQGEIADHLAIIAQHPNHLLLLADWKRLTPDQVARLKSSIASLRDLMPEAPVDEYKIEIRRYLGKAAALKDSLGRRNPGVAANAASTATDRSAVRLAICKKIVRLIDPRQIAVRGQIAEHWQACHQVYTAIAGHNHTFGMVHLAEGFDAGAVPAALVARCDELLAILENCDVLPWAHAFERSAVDVRAARTHLSRGEPAECVKFLRRVAVAMEQHLTLLRPWSDLLMELSIALRRRKPDQGELDAVIGKIEPFLRTIPVRRAADGTPERGKSGELVPLVDGSFRGVPISTRMYSHIEDGLLAWKRGDRTAAKEHFTAAEAIF